MGDRRSAARRGARGQVQEWGHGGAEPMKWVLIGAIRLYQVTLSGLFLNNCRFEPSCSRYGEEALSRHGVMRGTWLTAKRLSRCRPGGGYGYDPVPD